MARFERSNLAIPALKPQVMPEHRRIAAGTKENRPMKAVGYQKSLPVDDTNSLLDFETARPEPGGRDIRVAVKAISANPVDYKVRKRAAPPAGQTKILGYDAAGIVDAVGPDVTLFKPGDEVFYAGSILRQGTNSEFHLVDERIVGRKPKSLDFAQAAAIPLTAITAWECFHDRLKVQPKKSILLIGGAGGVGSIAIQLAKIAGLHVLATASRPESIAWVKELGADEVVNHRENLVSQINKKMDYIAVFNDLDQHWPAIGELIAPQGGIVSIVGNMKPLAMDAVRAKSASLCWELMFTRPRFQTPDMIEQHKLLNQVADWLDSGKLRGTLKETLSPINAANLRTAHAKLESGTMIGKLALKGW
jgi:zinc-binding alcohol dehydrogenase family protein